MMLPRVRQHVAGEANVNVKSLNFIMFKSLSTNNHLLDDYSGESVIKEYTDIAFLIQNFLHAVCTNLSCILDVFIEYLYQTAALTVQTKIL